MASFVQIYLSQEHKAALGVGQDTAPDWPFIDIFVAQSDTSFLYTDKEVNAKDQPETVQPLFLMEPSLRDRVLWYVDG